MTRFFHDITELRFRDPAGAVPTGSSICLTLIASEKISDPVLCLRFDPEDNPEQIHMEPAPEDAAAPGSQAGGFHAEGGYTSDGRALDGHAPEGHAGGGTPHGHIDGRAPEGHAGGGNTSGGYTVYTAHFTPREKGLYWYWFELPEEGIVISRDPATGQAAVTRDLRCWQITVCEPAYAAPDWIYGGVFYHIFVDRFAASGEPVYMDGKILRHDWGGMPDYQPNAEGRILNNDFFGGNLAGIVEKLPYLQKLGVTCLYLSPIFEAYSSHKYDTSDYMKVDPMFGDEAGFTRLCEEAGRLGMRVICDGVFSHTGSDSRYFDIHDRYGDGAYHHHDSPYRSWYYFEPKGYQTWWGIDTLPRIRKDNPSYQEFITGPKGVVRKWLAAGASGWRLDVVDELPASFLEKLTAGAKAEKADALILGEVWEDASNKIAYEERKNYFDGTKLDSVMNYPLRRGIIDYVRGGDAFSIARPMAQIMENYPLHIVHALMNILGTHDTDRIITALAGRRLGPDAGRKEKAAIRMDDEDWRIGIRRLKIAVVLQMTLPGVPCIYYGDEAGMEGYNDPFNRKCYPWGHENPEIQNWYRRVIAIRRSHKVYVDGSYRLLAARNGLYAFERRCRETWNGPAAEHSMEASGTVGGAAADGTVCGSAADGAVDGAAVGGAAGGAVAVGGAVCGAATTGGTASGAVDGAAVGGAAGGEIGSADRLLTVTNCGSDLQTLALFGRWKDLLSGTEFQDDVTVLPGQAMILGPAPSD